VGKHPAICAICGINGKKRHIARKTPALMTTHDPAMGNIVVPPFNRLEKRKPTFEGK
jgi:hypothetical protein